MKRVYISNLVSWHQDLGRKPLILRGARQVGKSTLVRIFAQENHLDLIEVNLEKNKFLCLEKDNFKIEEWVAEIEMISGQGITKKTLIFLDEIQAQPTAIKFLRYFYEERPELAIISAGSLLDIVLSQEEVSFPVGRVTFMWISPMTFKEFVMAMGREDLCSHLEDDSIPELAHPYLKELAKQYFYIGGMPEAVQTFINTKSYLKVREVHDDILETYIADFPKYEKRAKLSHLQSVFMRVTSQLGLKVIYQNIDRSLRSVEIKKCVDLLIKSNVLLPCYHVDANIPILSGLDYSVMKIYFLDIGLVNAIDKLSWQEFDSLFENSFNTKGYLAEQFIAQHLGYHLDRKRSPELYYWLRDKSRSKAEIDFIMQRKGKILPIEVKAAKGGRLKSMEVFSREKRIFTGYKFSGEFFHQEKIKIDDNSSCEINNIPYYAIEWFLKLASD